MHIAIILIGLYASLILAGGFIGYLKAGSKASLIAGGASFVLLGCAFYLAQSNEYQGLWMAAGIAGLLTIVFLMRFLKTRAFMPSGMMLILSLAAGAYFALTAHGTL